MSFTESTDQIYPDNAQGQLVEIPSLPNGATVDDIFYFQLTVSTGHTKYYKRVINGPMRAVECKIFGDGSDISARFQAAADAGLKVLTFDSPVDTDHVLSDVVTLPDDMIVEFQNDNVIGGSGNLIGGIIVCHPLKKCFDLDNGLIVAELQNNEVSVRWFGAVDDYDVNVGTITVNSSDGFTAAIGCFAERNDSYASIGNTVNIPACRIDKRYYCADIVLVNRTINLFGAGTTQTNIQFAQGKFLQYVYSVPATTKGIRDGGCWSKDFTVWGTNSGDNEAIYDVTKPGIKINAPFNRFDNIRAIGFNGNGIHIQGSTPTTNANSNKFYNCEGLSNGGSGAWLQGGDGNACVFFGGNFQTNGIAGIRDESFLGTYVFGIHTSANSGQNAFGSNAVWNRVAGIGKTYWCTVDNTNIEPGVDANWEDYWVYHSDSVAASYGYPAWDSALQYYGGGAIQMISANQDGGAIFCYSEGDEYQGKNTGRSIMIGGNHSQRMGNSIFTREGFLTFLGMQAENTDASVYARIEGETNRIGWYDVVQNIMFGLKYHVAEKLSTLGSANGFGNTQFLSSSASGSRIGRVAVPDGIINAVLGYWLRIESQDSARNLYGEYDTPTSANGVKAAGDIAFNFNPADFSILGWKTKTDGQPGAQVTIGKGRGTTSARPSFTAATSIGYEYFDTTLTRPIWWTGSAWIKADGTVV